MIREEKLYDHTSTTANSTQIELLKKHFPNCFDKNGAFMPHKMAEVVRENELSLSRESYSLNWLGKAYARVLAHETPLTLLKADEAHNQKEVHKKSENILIKGDNLEVLKHLRNAYAEQIKMIYIDPPYNTGSDGFVYNDDRKFTPEQLMRLAGIELEEAKRILDFTRSKANSHSAWLTFMYPRLYIARELLREDGVIFISIDENEQAQLKLLCDEVFGEENFIGNIANVNNPKGRSDDGYIATSHEYILAYKNKIPKIFGWIPDEKITKRYNKIDLSNGELYREIDLRKTGDNDRKEDRENLFYYFLYNETTNDLYPTRDANIPSGYIQIIPTREDESLGNWRWELSTSEKNLNKLLPKYMPVRKKWGIFEKDFLYNKNRIKPTSTWTRKNVNSERGTEQFTDLGFKKEIFLKPKPLGLIQNIMEFCVGSDDLILDFFAGSGTTAHAVMDLNAKDGGQRKYICVQLPEPTNTKSEAHKAGYNTIFDITKARIEKAAEKIRTETSLLTQELDLGFKIFETEPLFEGYGEEVETLAQDTTLFDGSTLDDESLQTLLYTWKLYDGLSLTTPTQRVMLAEYTAYASGKNLYIMHQGFDINAIKALICNLDDEANFNASKIVLFGYNVLSTVQRELHEALQNYTNKKSIELDVVVRY